MRDAAPFAIPEVICWRQLVTVVIGANVTGEAMDGLQPLIALCQGGTLSGPIDRCLCSDARFLPLGGEVSKAVQQTFGIRHLEARGVAQGEVGFDGVHHVSASGQGWAIVWIASTLGSLVPAALVLTGLVVMTRDVFKGHYAGLPLLGHLLAIAILFFLVLHSLVGALLPGRRRLGTSIGPQAVHRVVARTLAHWLETYRHDLAADLADFREAVGQ